MQSNWYSIVFPALITLVALLFSGWYAVKVIQTNRQLKSAFKSLPQGLCLFHADGRMVLCNISYLDTYGLSAEIVRPGASMQEIMRHRWATGLIEGDPDSFAAAIIERNRQGKRSTHTLKVNDRTILVNEVPVAAGWLTTHEDITKTRHAEIE